MATDEALITSQRQEGACYADGYNERLAAELVTMLPDDREQAWRVLMYVAAILNLELPPPSEG